MHSKFSAFFMPPPPPPHSVTHIWTWIYITGEKQNRDDGITSTIEETWKQQKNMLFYFVSIFIELFNSVTPFQLQALFFSYFFLSFSASAEILVRFVPLWFRIIAFWNEQETPLSHIYQLSFSHCVRRFNVIWSDDNSGVPFLFSFKYE